jgi:hypothetical protein
MNAETFHRASAAGIGLVVDVLCCRLMQKGYFMGKKLLRVFRNKKLYRLDFSQRLFRPGGGIEQGRRSILHGPKYKL